MSDAEASGRMMRSKGFQGLYAAEGQFAGGAEGFRSRRLLCRGRWDRRGRRATRLHRTPRRVCQSSGSRFPGVGIRRESRHRHRKLLDEQRWGGGDGQRTSAHGVAIGRGLLDGKDFVGGEERNWTGTVVPAGVGAASRASQPGIGPCWAAMKLLAGGGEGERDAVEGDGAEGADGDGEAGCGASEGLGGRSDGAGVEIGLGGLGFDVGDAGGGWAGGLGCRRGVRRAERRGSAKVPVNWSGSGPTGRDH